jgi:predicted flavoprotein YhiN
MRTDSVVVIGGGPAGMMASIAASRSGRTVTLIEKNHTFGKKLLLTGNGRCNFTNNADTTTFLSKFGKNGKFLRDAINAFSSQDLISFFEARGLTCKEEPGERVFPSNGNSSLVLEILEKEISRLNIKVLKNTSIAALRHENKQISGVELAGGKVVQTGHVILCTGGLSYPATGSSGDGFGFASSLGHNIVPLRPALVPLIVEEKYPESLAGLSLSGVSIKIFSGASTLCNDLLPIVMPAKAGIHKMDSRLHGNDKPQTFTTKRTRGKKTAKGDIIFTHNGFSGPLILSISDVISGLLRKNGKTSIALDLFPDMSFDEIRFLVTERMKPSPGGSMKACLKGVFPRRFLDLLLSEILDDPDKVSGQVTREELARLVSLCKDLRFTVTGTSPIEDAMVTAGGVSLKEVDPKTMSSKIISGLYFAGEILDIAGDTGGFNLQAAFSTGYLAGKSAGGGGNIFLTSRC